MVLYGFSLLALLQVITRLRSGSGAVALLCAAATGAALVGYSWWAARRSRIERARLLVGAFCALGCVFNMLCTAIAMSLRPLGG